ncbi:MAG: NTP transferase domain-containing protein [Dongiaceae bacterium]
MPSPGWSSFATCWRRAGSTPRCAGETARRPGPRTPPRPLDRLRPPPLSSPPISGEVRLKAVILAGGRGTRMGTEGTLPKPMTDLAGRPLVWHAMRSLAAQGIDEFILALGHRGEAFRHYFLNYRAMTADLSIDLRTGRLTHGRQEAEPWLVHLVDTGQATETGGRLKRLAPWLAAESDFLLTYGDSLADIDLAALLACHRREGRLATVTAVRTRSRFGHPRLEGDRVSEFREKPADGSGWINGGYFLLKPAVIELIAGDETVWEREPLEQLAQSGELAAYRHGGFWGCVDTPDDLAALEALTRAGDPPWLRARQPA